MGDLETCMESLKRDLAKALISSDIFASDGLSLLSYNSQEAAAAFFSELSVQMREALGSSALPQIQDYYLIELEEKSLVLVLCDNEFMWSMLIDGRQLSLGMLLNVIIPKYLKAFKAVVS
ncbi:MAG: hypothetical protein R2880_10045 [Deinococcales bacterium]